MDQPAVVEKRKPGRPNGSLNKNTIARQEQEAATLVASVLPQSSQDESDNVEETVNDDSTPPPAHQPKQKPPRPQPKQTAARPSRAAVARPAPVHDDEYSGMSDSPDEAVHRIKRERRYKHQPSHKVKRRGAKIIVLEDSSSSSDDDFTVVRRRRKNAPPQDPPPQQTTIAAAAPPPAQLDLRKQHMQRLNARRATYDNIFTHLR